MALFLSEFSNVVLGKNVSTSSVINSGRNFQEDLVKLLKLRGIRKKSDINEIVQLSESFFHQEMDERQNATFLSKLEQVFRNLNVKSDKILQWQNIISEIRKLCFPYFKSHYAFISNPENLLHQSRILLSEMGRSTQWNETYLHKQQEWFIFTQHSEINCIKRIFLH